MKKMWVVFEGALVVAVAVALSAATVSAADAPPATVDSERISEDFTNFDVSLIHPWDNPQGKDSTKPQGSRIIGDIQPPTVRDHDGNESGNGKVAARKDVELLGNYPNPFNAETRIAFSMTEAGRAELRIYNILGQTVRAVDFAGLGAGRHEWNWDGKVGGGGVAPSGIYFYRVTTLRSSAIDRMVLLK
jgi:hypothetical protein